MPVMIIIRKKETVMLRKRISALKNRFTSLSLMRADGELGKEEFAEMKMETQEQVQVPEKELSGIEHGRYDWKKIAEDHLNFLQKGIEIINKGDEMAVREFISKIGSNRRLLDKKLYFTKSKSLLAIGEFPAYYTARKARFEPVKSPVKYGDFGAKVVQNKVLPAFLLGANNCFYWGLSP